MRLFTDPFDSQEGNNFLRKSAERRNSQAVLHESGGLNEYVVAGQKLRVSTQQTAPYLDGARMIGVVLIQERIKGRSIYEHRHFSNACAR